MIFIIEKLNHFFIMDTYDKQFFQQFGFEFMKVVGHGTFGVVYLVMCQQYKMQFALKRIFKENFNQSEIDCMVMVKSSYIVNLYKYYNFGPYIYLLMEFCPSSIDNILKETKDFQTERIQRIAYGMALAVKGCHQFGFSHGDIKPSNFLLDSYDRVKICDFGLAHKSLHQEETTEWSGTLVFLAPEVIRFRPYDAFAADIWSLGVSLYMVATGQYPWNIHSSKEMVKNIMSANYDDKFILDPLLKNVICECLQLNPKLRPTADMVVAMFNSKQNSPRVKIHCSLSTHRPMSLILAPRFKKRRLSFA